ncbi:hypothetical protein ACFFSY_17920 [Paenibacillus aurantiacus]|uniref:Uncharacterized protein n=1 Tax=Paenibacillus aurantiacus TaxID=1936118 RepID=A0ABV5KRH2_9BACL
MNPAAITIGMMCLGRIDTIEKYALAAVSKMHDVQFYYFIPEDVRAEDQRITGYVMENNQWVRREMAYPDVVHDAIGRKGKLFLEAYAALSHLPFTTDKPAGCGSKLEKFRLIRQDGRFKQIPHRFRAHQHFLKQRGFYDVARARPAIKSNIRLQH